ncbi:hypothetical protein E2C01_051564 [Portunus trituberculatus]|uniref:Uncharacterized protein n=1 Tax=Portunus trituberculatus TaxID=210409 RepID=A0A5B7GBY5_PORTR|nr:hypothetical protein [Portunus trituberculatus]
MDTNTDTIREGNNDDKTYKSRRNTLRGSIAIVVKPNRLSERSKVGCEQDTYTIVIKDVIA